MSNSLIILNVLHSHSTSTKCSSPQGASKAVVDTWTHSRERHTNKLTQRNALLYITTSRASYSITRRIVSFLFWSVVFYGLHFTSWQRSNLTIHRPYISFLFFFSRQLTPTGHDVHQFVIFAEKQLGTEKRTKKVVAKVELKVSSTFFGISWGRTQFRPVDGPDAHAAKLSCYLSEAHTLIGIYIEAYTTSTIKYWGESALPLSAEQQHHSFSREIPSLLALILILLGFGTKFQRMSQTKFSPPTTVDSGWTKCPKNRSKTEGENSRICNDVTPTRCRNRRRLRQNGTQSIGLDKWFWKNILVWCIRYGNYFLLSLPHPFHTSPLAHLIRNDLIPQPTVGREERRRYL